MGIAGHDLTNPREHPRAELGQRPLLLLLANLCIELLERRAHGEQVTLAQGDLFCLLGLLLGDVLWFVARTEFGVLVAQLVENFSGHGRREQRRDKSSLLGVNAQRVAWIVGECALELGALGVLKGAGPGNFDIKAWDDTAPGNAASGLVADDACGGELVDDDVADTVGHGVSEGMHEADGLDGVAHGRELRADVTEGCEELRDSHIVLVVRLVVSKSVRK